MRKPWLPLALTVIVAASGDGHAQTTQDLRYPGYERLRDLARQAPTMEERDAVQRALDFYFMGLVAGLTWSEPPADFKYCLPSGLVLDSTTAPSYIDTMFAEQAWAKELCEEQGEDCRVGLLLVMALHIRFPCDRQTDPGSP